MIDEYRQFLLRKAATPSAVGLDVIPDLHPVLMPHQRDVTQFLLRIGRGAAFLDTGLGKTAVQLEWARHVPADVLILAPLAVAQQTVREAKNLLGIDCAYSRDGSKAGKITVTNYERLDKFDLSQFGGVVLDESSILKAFMGKTRDMLVQSFEGYRWKLCCTATPAPNDYTELGNHAEFLGVMERMEMLQRWFTHDSGNTQLWRLKGHAIKSFWQWVASWAACVSKPSDLGHDDAAYALPPLKLTRHIVETDITEDAQDGFLFRIPDVSATTMHKEKRLTLTERVAKVVEIVTAAPDEPWIVWCESNAESEALAKALPHFVEVTGSQSPDRKEELLDAFSTGRAMGIITKPSIAGFGLNWQHCARVCFASLSYSFEQFYQAVRRSWRFGQKRPVEVHAVLAHGEDSIWSAITRKMNSHDEMRNEMRHAVFGRGQSSANKVDYNPQHIGRLPQWLTAA